MKEIRLASKYLSLVRGGEKTTTIRRGHRDYTPGPALITNAQTQLPIYITDVRYVRLNELTTKDANADGFPDLMRLREDLDSFYPKLKHDEPMTIVRFILQ